MLQAPSLFATWPLFAAGLVSLATGVLLGLGSRYGIVRYWWVALKLALSLLLTSLVLIGLRPGIAELERLGRELAVGASIAAPLGGMIFPPTVSPICLAIPFILAVYKPWGRIRLPRYGMTSPPGGTSATTGTRWRQVKEGAR